MINTGSHILQLETTFKEINDNYIEPTIDLITGRRSNKATGLNLMTTSRIIQKISTAAKQGAPYQWDVEFYARYKKILYNFIADHIQTRLADAFSKNKNIFIDEWITCATMFNYFCNSMQTIFMCLNKMTYFNPMKDPVEKIGAVIMRDHIYNPYRELICEIIQDMITQLRRGEYVKMDQIQKAIYIFINIGFNTGRGLNAYILDFENFFLEQSALYYQRLSAEWISTPTLEYFKRATDLIAAETNLIRQYTNEHTLEPAAKLIYERVLRDPCETLMRRGESLAKLLASEHRYAINLVSGRDAEHRCAINLVSGRDAEHRCAINLVSGRDAEHRCAINLVSGRDAEHRYAINLVSESTDADAAAAALRDIYSMYKDYPEWETVICKIFAEEIVKKEIDLVNQLRTVATDENITVVLRAIVTSHAHYMAIANDYFEKNSLALRTIRASFEKVLNKDSLMAGLLAKFSHNVMRMEEQSMIINNIVFIYSYLAEKDIFEQHYQQYLSQRLLNNQSASNFFEKDMIARLKTACGYQWTAKLEGMLKDVETSREMPPHHMPHGFELSAIVCTSGNWPDIVNTAVILPPNIAAAADRFTAAYKNKFSGRKLMWRFDQGSAEVEVRFSAKVKRLLVVSTYQMLILHCFSDSAVAARSFREIRDAIVGPNEQAYAAAKVNICNALLSLAHPECAVLEKKPNNKALEDDHLFRLNNKFSSKLLRVKIPTHSLYSVNTVDDSVQKAAIIRQRSYMAQAAIVRIMKIRKTLEHSKLMAEVIAQLKARFTIDLIMIKKCIENLITDEYMRRDEDERSLYHYVA